MTYKEITILFKNDPNSHDVFDTGSYSVTYENVGCQINGDYFVLEVIKENEIEGHILPLKTIINYKIIK
jgi:hypothetical protein